MNHGGQPDRNTGADRPRTPDEGATANRAAAPNLAAAIDQLWVRFLPEIRQRVDLLEAAATACSEERLSPAQREAVQAAAHKLAGTLGTFKLSDGTVLARELELLLSSEDVPDSALAGRLAVIATELRTIVESRK